MQLGNQFEPCVVSYRPQAPWDWTNVVSSSGLLFCEYGMILAPGCLLLESTDIIEDMLSHCSKADSLLGTFEVAITGKQGRVEPILEQAECVDIWQCKDISSVIKDICSLKLGESHLSIIPMDDSPTDTRERETDALLASTFLFLRLDKQNALDGSWAYPTLSRNLTALKFEAGCDMLLCSTPFGNNHLKTFMNSWSKGIVAKVLKGNCALVDLKCAPGSQGGVVFSRKDQLLVPFALLVCPILIKNNECTGLSLVCRLEAILSCRVSKQRLELLHMNSIAQPLRLQLPLDRTLPSMRRIIRIRVGQVWGSGILFGSNHSFVLTCAHVIKDAANYPIQCYYNGHCSNVDIIYCSLDMECFDIAVLKATWKPNRNISSTFFVKKPVTGSQIFAVGYGLFSSGNKPLVTSGIISKVHLTTMLTTSLVHPGCSGGAFVDKHGSFIALISSSIQDTYTKTTYPNLSLGLLLSNTLIDALERISTSRDSSLIQQLEKQSSRLIKYVPPAKL